MKPTRKTIAGITGATVLIMGGIDATQLREQPIERIEMIANERVEAKQIENVVETTFPWKGEQGIKVKYDMGEPTLRERMADKRSREVITEQVDIGDGGFKVDIILNEPPTTNVFCYVIEGAENYDFFYQPEITDEEAEVQRGGKEDTRTLEEIKRDMRPEEIVGSYAVYHKELKNHKVGKENYATGKVMHIPRPQVWSMSDEENKIWADLSYNDAQSTLCVTVDEDFLEKAEYPVRVDPTFGYTSVGGYMSSTYIHINASPFTLGEDGNVTSIHSYNKRDSGTTALRHAIYSDVSNTPSVLLGYSASSVTVNTSATWRSTPVNVDLDDGVHWLAFWMNSTTNVNYYYYDIGGTSQVRRRNSVTGFPAWPSPLNPDAAGSTIIPSIYATYTADEGDPDPVTPAQSEFWF